MTDDIEKRTPKTTVEDEDSVEVEDDTAADSGEKLDAVSKKAVKGKKAVDNSHSDDFRLRQLDFEDGDAVYRRKWWQLW